MNKTVTAILERTSSWPPEAIDELARAAEDIERRLLGLALTTRHERALIDEGLAEADRGEFVSDADLKRFWARNKAAAAPKRRA